MRSTASTNHITACTFCNTAYTFLVRCAGPCCTAYCCPNCLDPDTSCCIECADEQKKRDAWNDAWEREQRDSLASILLTGALIGVGSMLRSR